MIDARSTAILLEVLTRESRNHLQYLNEVLPWPMPEDPVTLASLELMIADERKEIIALGRFLIRHRVMPPPLPPFPDYTGINFTTLDSLFPILIEDEKKGLARLERDVLSVTDPEARKALESLLSVKRRLLGDLEALAKAHMEKATAQAAVAST